MKRFLLASMAISLGMVLLVSTGFAQGKGHNKDKGDKHSAQRSDDRDEHRPVFSDHDRDIIRGYFRDRYSNLPPGLAKRNGNLPPGLQKHLERDGTLPPGLQKRVSSLPVDLERRLPRLPTIYRRGSIGSSVVILDRRTQRIMDIIDDVLRP